MIAEAILTPSFKTKYRPIRYEYARGVVQASEEEFHRALRDYHILNVTGSFDIAPV